jgi:recombination associated protein RdgC
VKVACRPTHLFVQIEIETMFKNITLYRISNLPDHFGVGAAELCPFAFEPCGPTQEKSVGWIPPRGHENGALIESVAGQIILKLMIESKTVPADVIRREVAERTSHIESSTGRKPGKKETREISEDVRQFLLPMAFTKQAATLVWIDKESKLMVIDSASQSRLDDVLTALVKSIDGLELQMVNTIISPASAMAQWLIEQEGPSGFTVDRECELKACDESKAVVKYGRHPLDIEEVAQHITQGKMPTRLAMTWNDRVSFVLTDGFKLKKLEFLETVFENAGGSASHEDQFDADVAISTGELKNMIHDLIEALAGEPS